MNLTNNTILITGGGSGIGLALAENFKSLGNTVIVAGRSLKKLEAARVKGLEAYEVDLNSSDGIQELSKKVLKDFPGLNAVIHSAGIMQNENLKLGVNAETMKDTVLTNILGTLLLNDALVPHFLKQPSATIITVTSGLAYAPLTMTPSYCASKAAIHSYTESLRHQLRDTKVQVIELIPPYVQTALMGERQAQDPMAMPLSEFISEVFEILKKEDGPAEVAVKRVLPQRLSSYQGQDKYQEFFT